MATKFATQFSHPETKLFSCDTPSMTEQQFEHELNINNIVSGQVQSFLPSTTSEAIYGLTITGNEFETSLNSNSQVMNYFEELPVKAKKYFDYKPQNMLEFIQNDDNYEKAFEIGLINKDAYQAFKNLKVDKKSGSLADTIKSVNTVTSENSDVIPNSME